MSFNQTQQQEIKEMVRAIVREELKRLRNEVVSPKQRYDKEIDRLARPISRPELKIAIQELLTNDPDTFFAILRDVRDDMEAEGLLDREPTPSERVRAEVETELAALADFFRGFA